jgi:hypothetical protein
MKDLMVAKITILVLALLVGGIYFVVSDGEEEFDPNEPAFQIIKREPVDYELWETTFNNAPHPLQVKMAQQFALWLQEKLEGASTVESVTEYTEVAEWFALVVKDGLKPQ